ncbi:type IV pili twitching motility protein PilT [Kangiella profundi]|uniref:Type IV pili twitching motility protein PilT n=1 Tax=Kangiella profundi TaxID=1561924 RepID=A0A2K9AYU7_9GAMM|nr:PilT/PilU family type 4a pilus ATPase [Kangiella profundi]AUD77858.1 type IV pili twitching motility protein PilT [Kangiella profundi]GGE91935.1 twitching motility protein PilU [Kangiella profundi]
MDINPLLKALMEHKGSDLFITVHRPPCIKINGQIRPVTKSMLTPAQVEALIHSSMTEKQMKEFEEKKECQYAISVENIGRFRASAFYQRNQPGLVVRRIETKIPTTEDLKIPNILNELAMKKRGIIIFVGATGTGKSTSLAAMIGYRNHNSAGHIISIEDPIEYVHRHDKCIITQREVGIDTESFETALKNTLRQAPDVILIGEVRSKETMSNAITFAETGHLCLCTLHANNANQAIDRILHFFPKEEHSRVLMDLSLNTRAIIAQQLVPTRDGKGRRAAIEILINTPLISDHIRKGEVHLLKELMARSRELGMQTFDQALFDLYVEGEISYEDALLYADSANDLRLKIKLHEKDADSLTDSTDGLQVEMDDDRSNRMF